MGVWNLFKLFEDDEKSVDAIQPEAPVSEPAGGEEVSNFELPRKKKDAGDDKVEEPLPVPPSEEPVAEKPAGGEGGEEDAGSGEFSVEPVEPEEPEEPEGGEEEWGDEEDWEETPVD